MSDKDKASAVAWKVYQKQPLTQDEFSFQYNQLTNPDAVDNVGAAAKTELDKQVAAENQRLADTKATQATSRESQIAAYTKKLDAQLAQQQAANQAAGQKQGQAVQGALSFSGFGRSTYNADKQGEIQKEVAQRDALLQQAHDENLLLYQAKLEGADAQTLEGIQQGINDLKKSAANLMLQSAVKTAELNEANKVTSLEAITNMTKALGTNSGVDESLTKTIDDGYVYTKDGGRLQVNGQDLKTGVNSETIKARKEAIDAYMKFRNQLVAKGVQLNAEVGAEVLANIQKSDNPQAVLDQYIALASSQDKVQNAFAPIKSKGKNTTFFQLNPNTGEYEPITTAGGSKAPASPGSSPKAAPSKPQGLGDILNNLLGGGKSTPQGILDQYRQIKGTYPTGKLKKEVLDAGQKGIDDLKKNKESKKTSKTSSSKEPTF
jgi:hypothetical protein